MSDSAPGRAISGGAPPSAEVDVFSAKYERPSGKLASALAALKLRKGRVIFARGEAFLYSRDQSEVPNFLQRIMFKSLPDAVVQPGSSDEVAAILVFASARRIAVVPRGAGSSPFGGSVPVKGGLVVDMSRMDEVLGLDYASGTVRVEAGARWADVDCYLEKHGLALRTCPSGKFSTVGGWIATGGYGLNSLSRGHIRESVVSLELVTPDGRKRMLRPGTQGFAEVFGSEGQLGIVASVELATKMRPGMSRPHLVMFSDVKSALGFARELLGSDVRPAHVLFENSSRIATANKLLGKDYLKNAEAVVVSVESQESEDALSRLLKSVDLQEEKEFLARYLWNERFFPMKVRKLGPGMLGTEVLMPLEKLDLAIERAGEVCSALGIEPFFEVHYLKGSDALLLCFFLTDQSNTGMYTVDAFKSLLLSRALLDVGGKPYSLGIWNYPFSDSEEMTHRMRAAKDSFDPRGVMNPGKYFSLSGRLGGLAALAFNPKLMGPLLRAVLMSLPLSSRAVRCASRLSGGMVGDRKSSHLLTVADECAMCGACVNVCPAYLHLGDERVTARGKLLTSKMMARGGMPSKEHAHRTFLCMRCKACEQVCQSKLELLDAYDELESKLEHLHGKDVAEIERFVRFVESSSEYESLIEQGLVIGAPRYSAGGVRGDV